MLSITLTLCEILLNHHNFRSLLVVSSERSYCLSQSWFTDHWTHGPFTRYVKLRITHAPGMPGTFSPPLLVSDPDMHHGTCVTHVPWSMTGSLTIGFLSSRWRGKRSRHSRRTRNAQFYVSGKRSMGTNFIEVWIKVGQFPFTDTYLIMLSAIRWPFCREVNV